MKRRPSPFQLQLFPALDETPSATPPPAPVVEPPEAPRPQTEKDGVQRLRQALPGLLGASQRRLGSLTLTDNRSTIVSAREVAGRLDVRIHRCFASAPDETLTAVATFLNSGKRSQARRQALATIRAYFEQHRPASAATRRPRRVVLRPVGEHLDLREVRDRLNRKFFDDALDVHITWGRAHSRRRRRRSFSIRLGTFSDQDQVVRIHRCLDRPDVPRYVVESVVYHEMLHAAMPPEVKNGRRRIHPPEFRRRERMFPGYQRAERWLDRNLQRLV